MLRYSDFIVQPLRNQRYKVLKDINLYGIKVPKGYRTNGGNIPRLLWSILPPNDSEMLPLYIVHDYLCDLELYELADETLFRVGVELNVARWKLNIVYFAVRAYHIIKYGD